MGDPKPVDMRRDMPETARWIDARRAEWGKAHVNDCIRRAMAKEPGWFYAMERGHGVGMPFPATHALSELQAHAVITGSTFAAFLARPLQASAQEGKQ